MIRRALPSLVIGLFSAGALLVSTPAQAQPASAAEKAPRVHLSWVRDREAAEACPDVSQVQADVAGRLGYSPFVAGDQTSASIEVLVTHGKSLWQAGAVMRNADGTMRGNRHVESAASDCHSLAAAAALAIALMIDPDIVTNPPRVGPARPVVVPPTPPRPVAKPAPRLPPAQGGPHGAVSLGVLGATGVLPKLAAGPLLRGELEVQKRLALVVSAQFLPEQRVARAGADAWFGLALGSLGACYRVDLGEHWAVASCGSFLAGSLSLAIVSPEAVQAGPTPWFGVACGLRVALRSGAFEVTLGGDALAHLARHDYTVSRLQPTRTESLFTEPAAGALGSLTTGVRF